MSQSKHKAELVWTRASEVKWKHMAELRSTLEVKMTLIFGPGMEQRIKESRKHQYLGAQQFGEWKKFGVGLGLRHVYM